MIEPCLIASISIGTTSSFDKVDGGEGDVNEGIKGGGKEGVNGECKVGSELAGSGEGEGLTVSSSGTDVDAPLRRSSLRR